MKTSKTLAIILILFIPSFTFAQAPKVMSLDELISLAKTQNLQLQADELNIEAASKLKKSSFELPKTTVNFQYGQFNSIAMDNSVNINQGIPFPTVFSAKSHLYEALKEESKMVQAVSLRDLEYQVSTLYYEIQFLENEALQLKETERYLNNLVQASIVRFQSGESNQLEKTSANSKLGQVRMLSNENAVALESAYLYLKKFLNSKELFKIEAMDVYEPINGDSQANMSLKVNHPQLTLNEQQVLIKSQERKLEKALVLPDFNVGYFNQSITGFQNVDGNEVFFNKSQRFQGLNVGLSLPITAFSNSAKIKAMNFEQQALAKKAEDQKNGLQTQLDELMLKRDQLLKEYQYYKDEALIDANTIEQVANVSLKSGAIHYLEFIQAIQQSLDIKMGYLNTIRKMNQNHIQINYLTKQ